MTRPNGLIATEGIELLTGATSNGFKATIILEELKEAYGLHYTWQHIDVLTEVQKEPWFIAVNPNGCIPAIVDHDNGDLAVFESNAILGYLTRRYDLKHLLSFPVDDDDYTRCESWIGWQHSGIGPMYGINPTTLSITNLTDLERQAESYHFIGLEENIPWAIFRFVGETERLYGVLDSHLASRDFIVGPGRGCYSIADIGLLGWVNGSQRSNHDVMIKTKFTNVWAWFQRCWARPAVQRAFTIPKPPRYLLIEKPEGEDELREQEGIKKMIEAAKDKYGYVYSSP